MSFYKRLNVELNFNTMIKIVKYVFCILALLVSVHATSIAQSKFEYGAKLGGNYGIISMHTTVASPTANNINPKGFGFHAGGYALYKFTEKLGARAEALVSFMPTNVTNTTETSVFIVNNSIERNDKTNYTYISVPIMANYRLSKHFSFQLGPQFSFITNYKDKYDMTNTTTYTSFFFSQPPSTSKSSGKNSDMSVIHKWDISAAGGATYEMNMGLNIGVRYIRGLNSINSNASGITEKWNIIQVSVGFLIGGGNNKSASFN